MALLRYLKPEHIYIRCPLETKEGVLEWLSMVVAESGIGIAQETLREELFDLFGQGIGGNVIVFWGAIEQFVAHGTARKIGGETRTADLLKNIERVIVWLVH